MLPFDKPPMPKPGFDSFSGDRIHPMNDPNLSGPKPGGPGPYPVLGTDRDKLRGSPNYGHETTTNKSGGGGGWLLVVLAIVGVITFLQEALSTTWEGVINQQGRQPYPVQMTLWDQMEVGKSAGKIEYPSLHCSGSLTLTAIENGNTYLFQEKIESGRENCASDGVIRATKNQEGDKMAWQWFYPDGRKGAEAVLAKRNR